MKKVLYTVGQYLNKILFLEQRSFDYGEEITI